MNGSKRFALGTLATGLVHGFFAPAASAEVITLRSGQVASLPGVAGQLDDIANYRPGTPAGAPASATPFGPADFSGADTGPDAVVVNAHPAWAPGLSDPLARWINHGVDLNPDGTGSGYGTPGSVLYSIPFWVNTNTITSAVLSLEFAVDDGLGDTTWGGANPDGLYLNGSSLGFTGGNYATPTFHTQNITAWITPGQNYLYFYQRDAGVLVSGLIFSATIDIVPTPGAASLLALSAIASLRRVRRRPPPTRP